MTSNTPGPELPSDPALWPAHEQARQVAAGQLSAVELLEACLGRWQHHDAALNAVACERVDAARVEARAADAHSGPAGSESDGLALRGVPMTVKEAFDVAGLATTWGAVEHADNVAGRTAQAVSQLTAAGAVLWGKTNVPRRLGEWQTFNEMFGETVNPWDESRTPGGSSGGSAVAIAMGYSALELGSDIGGSIRFPAHYCGVYGHKPSFGAVSASGHDWPGQIADVDINVCGPIARSAADLRLAMTILSERRLPSVDKPALTDFTVGVMLENPYGGEQDRAMTDVLRRAVELLGSAGVRLVEPPAHIDHRHAHELYLVLNHAAESNVEQMDDAEVLAGRYRSGDRSIEACVGYAGTLSHAAWLDYANEREALRRQWQDWFQSVDLLLCPVSASAAPPRQTDVPFFDQTIPVNGRQVPATDQWFWAGIANGSYLPSTAFPVGQTRAALPVGMQALGPYGNDLLPIRFAELAAEVLGGWQPPPMAL